MAAWRECGTIRYGKPAFTPLGRCGSSGTAGIVHERKGSSRCGKEAWCTDSVDTICRIFFVRPFLRPVHSSRNNYKSAARCPRSGASAVTDYRDSEPGAASDGSTRLHRGEG